MKKKLIISTVVIALIAGFWFWNKKRIADQEMEAYLHRKIESKLGLSDAQKVGMPAADSKSVKVIRYRDSSGNWKTALNYAPEGAKDEMALGTLHSTPVGTTVNVPVYFCAGDLIVSKNCPGGKNAEEPAGYLSRDIRAGYFLLFHCRSSKSGLYLTLNSRCESPEDAIQDSLGAIRALDN